MHSFLEQKRPLSSIPITGCQLLQNSKRTSFYVPKETSLQMCMKGPIYCSFHPYFPSRAIHKLFNPVGYLSNGIFKMFALLTPLEVFIYTTWIMDVEVLAKKCKKCDKMFSDVYMKPESILSKFVVILTSFSKV